MGVWGKVKNVLYKLDFFYTAELLRFREEPEYRTIFGGVISLSIIILLLVTFYNKVIDTFQKVIISSSYSSVNANDPTSYTISTMPGMPFMLGVQIWHHNLNSNPRYFDVVLTNVFYNVGQFNETMSVTVPLEPCTLQHWSESPQIQSNLRRLQIGYWLCLPKNSEFEIFGKFSSVTSRTLDISVNRCTNSSYFTYPCASDSEIDSFIRDEQNLFYSVYFVNPLIYTDKQDYLSYYLEDINYVIFSATDGEECQLLMEDFTITTDQSIAPFTEDNVKSGGIITKNCIKNRYTIDSNNNETTYAKIMFYKSPISKSISRSFQKIDQILSYIGGLFGTISICLFLANVYNGYSFQILIGGYLFTPDDDNMKKDLKKYNFFYFLVHLFYDFISMFGDCCNNWKKAKLYYECREEMTKQLDVLYLYKRLVILERGLGTLLSEKQITGLHLIKQPTLNQAKKMRRKYKFNQDSFLYRALGVHRSLLESLSKAEEKRMAERPESSSDPNISQDQLSVPSPEKHFFPHERAKGSSKHADFLNEHEESSDSEEEDGDLSETKELLQELASLRDNANREPISKRIWQKLSQGVQSVVEEVSQATEEKRGGLRDDNNYVFEEEAFDPLRRRPKAGRFGQLPALMVPQEVKVVNTWQNGPQQGKDRPEEESLDNFIQMKEFEHIPRQEQE